MSLIFFTHIHKNQNLNSLLERPPEKFSVMDYWKMNQKGGIYTNVFNPLQINLCLT